MLLELYICMYFFRLFSIISYHKILNILCYAIKQDFVVYLFYIISINPKLLIYPLPFPFGLCECQLLSLVQLFGTPWTVGHQASLPMGWSRQEYQSILLFPSLGDLSDLGIKLESPALQTNFLWSEPPEAITFYVCVSVSVSKISALVSFFQIPCMWYYMIFVILCVTDFIQFDNLQVLPCCYKWHYSFFLWLSNIPIFWIW